MVNAQDSILVNKSARWEHQFIYLPSYTNRTLSTKNKYGLKTIGEFHHNFGISENISISEKNLWLCVGVTYFIAGYYNEKVIDSTYYQSYGLTGMTSVRYDIHVLQCPVIIKYSFDIKKIVLSLSGGLAFNSGLKNTITTDNFDGSPVKNNNEDNKFGLSFLSEIGIHYRVNDKITCTISPSYYGNLIYGSMIRSIGCGLKISYKVF